MYHGGRMPTERARVLVLGDSGSGKTSLIHLLCHEEVLRGQYSTTGCHIEVKLHTGGGGRACFVELWDVGGSQKYRDSRGIFYTQPIHGIILVHDISNAKSWQNLRRWIKEVSDGRAGVGVNSGNEDDVFDRRSTSINNNNNNNNSHANSSGPGPGSFSYSFGEASGYGHNVRNQTTRTAAARSLFSSPGGSSSSVSNNNDVLMVNLGRGEYDRDMVPCLIVGTHADGGSLSGVGETRRSSRLSDVIADPEDLRGEKEDELIVDAMDAATFSAASLASRRFRAFFDRVVGARLHQGGVSGSSLSAALGPGGVVSAMSMSSPSHRLSIGGDAQAHSHSHSHSGGASALVSPPHSSLYSPAASGVSGRERRGSASSRSRSRSRERSRERDESLLQPPQQSQHLKVIEEDEMLSPSGRKRLRASSLLRK